MLALWDLGWVLFVEAVRLWVDRPTALVAGAARDHARMGELVDDGARLPSRRVRDRPGKHLVVARSRAGGATGSARMVVAGALLALLALMAALLGSGVVAIGGVPALWAARSSTTNAPQRSDLTALVAVREDRGLEDVYCLDGMLQWNLMFMSGGRISARWLAPLDRRPEVLMATRTSGWHGRRRLS